MINVYGLLCLSCHDLTRDHIAISLLYVQMLALMDVGQTIKRLLRFFPFPKGCEGRCQELEVVARRAPWLPVILYCHPLEEVIWRKKKTYLIILYLRGVSQGARLLVSAIFIRLNTDFPFSVWFSSTTLAKIWQVSLVKYICFLKNIFSN